MSTLDAMPYETLLELPEYVQQEYPYRVRYKIKGGHEWSWCFRSAAARHEHVRDFEFFLEPNSAVFHTVAVPKNAVPL